MILSTYKILDGNEAVCEAVRLSRVEVIAVFPITPMTTIANQLADWTNSGELKAELIQPENEHGSLEICFGASAAGTRTFTASCSQGIVFMEEMIWAIPGYRLPVVMTVCNRSISHPGGLQSTHSDSLLQRDSGWIQFYCEDPQESLDTLIMAYKIAEDKRVLLPTMTTLDGYTVSACAVPVKVPDQRDVDTFLPEYVPEFYLNPNRPPVIPKGIPDEADLRSARAETELRYMVDEVMTNSKEVISQVNQEFGERFGRMYGNGLVEKYRCEDAQGLLITMGSLTGTARDAIDELRSEGKPIGLVKLKSFRPFPTEDIMEICRQVEAVGVVDKNFSHGSSNRVGISNLEIARTLYELKERPHLLDFIIGIGGRDVTTSHIRYIADRVLDTCETGKVERPVEWIQLK